MDAEIQTAVGSGSKKACIDFDKINLSDDLMFSLVMQDEEICRIVLSIVLGKKIVKVDYVNIQKTVNNTPDRRAIRLDVYAVDQDGVIYDVEMQKSEQYDLPKRSRFYQGLMDTSLLQKGIRSYNSLKESYVIFITDFDVFGKGFYKYTFRNLCLEDNRLELGDASTKMFLNTTGTVRNGEPQALLDFLKYVHDSNERNACNRELQKLHKRFSDMKNMAEVRNRYMMDMLRDEEKKEEGRAEGRAEERESIAMLTTQ